jgi:hypothetical protein
MQRRKFFLAQRALGNVGGSMTDEELEVELETILTDKRTFNESEDPRLHGKSFEDLIAEHDFTFYIGMVSTSCYNNDDGRVTRQRNVCVRRSN